MDRNEMMAGMAEQFMSNWRSAVFRERCVAQIDSVRSETNPRQESGDHVEKFLAQNTSEQLEEFVFSKSSNREDYMSLIAETMMMLRQHREMPRVNVSVLQNASPEELAASDISQEELNSLKTTAHNGKPELSEK